MNAARALWVARRRAGLTQRELGGRSGVLPQAIGRIERGEVVPGVGTLDRLLDACGFMLSVAPRRRDGDRAEIRMLALPRSTSGGWRAPCPIQR